MDYKQKIIDELTVILEREKQNGNTFKIRAYQRVIPQLRALHYIKSLDDIKNVDGIGKGIKDRIKEILETGQLNSAEEAKKDPKTTIIKEFMNIYGIGTVKSKNLYEVEKVTSIEELREKADKLLNEKQKIGLKYYEDLLERIPRKEMLYHEKVIKKIVATISRNKFVATIVGSFRREKPDSGDIDVLLSYPETEAEKPFSKTEAEKPFSKTEAEKPFSKTEAESIFKQIVDEMVKLNYITDILALGSKKCLAICRKENEKTRRLDLLLTPPDEYPYAILYFTGSDKFNIQMRRKALELGYSLSEHGLIPMRENVEVPDDLKTEKEVFKFLKMDYLEPKDR